MAVVRDYMLILGGGDPFYGDAPETSALIAADLSAGNLSFAAVDVFALPPNADPRPGAQVLS